jgi:hypothetical protein
MPKVEELLLAGVNLGIDPAIMDLLVRRQRGEQEAVSSKTSQLAH